MMTILILVVAIWMLIDSTTDPNIFPEDIEK